MTSAGINLIMLGAGGHAKVLLDLARACGYRVMGVCDPQLVREGQSTWRDVNVLGGDDALMGVDPATVGLINGLGQLVGNHARTAIYDRVAKMGYRFPALVHPTAWIAPSVELSDGVQIMAGAIVQADCRIGKNTVINTGAQVDHDCRIGDHVHIAPGAVLCGAVWIGSGAFVGAGATVLPGLHMEANAVLGAGLTLRHALSHGQVFTGNRKFS